MNGLEVLLQERTPFFNSLIDRIIAGEVLDFSSITKGELTRLWGKETVPESLIAEVYDVPKGKVTYRRRKWGITDDNLFENPFEMMCAVERRASRHLQPYELQAVRAELREYVMNHGPIESIDDVLSQLPISNALASARCVA